VTAVPNWLQFPRTTNLLRRISSSAPLATSSAVEQAAPVAIAEDPPSAPSSAVESAPVASDPPTTPTAVESAPVAAGASGPAELLAEADTLHAAAEFDALLAKLQSAAELDGGGAPDVELAWRLARAHHDVADGLKAGARDEARREALVRAGLAVVERARAAYPDVGMCHKWYGILLGTLGDFLDTKTKIGNSREIKAALDAAAAALPDDGSVQLALGQWSLKIASISFVERQVAKALFGEPPSATLADALVYFRRADELKPSTKTRALIKTVTKKMG
jgi:hypothetical protein